MQAVDIKDMMKLKRRLTFYVSDIDCDEYLLSVLGALAAETGYRSITCIHLVVHTHRSELSQVSLLSLTPLIPSFYSRNPSPHFSSEVNMDDSFTITKVIEIADAILVQEEVHLDSRIKMSAVSVSNHCDHPRKVSCIMSRDSFSRVYF